MNIIEKFARLDVDNAPGQEGRQKAAQLDIRGEKLSGVAVDFSHGDVDAFAPIPGALETFISGVELGGEQAYTEYRGKKHLREYLAQKLAAFAGVAIDPEQNIILTPGTQGALFLAMGATVAHGDKVAIVEPDYFANRKLVAFLGGQLMPAPMYHTKHSDCAGLDLAVLEQAFKDGAKVFLFSNPNNPTGVLYSAEEISAIAKLSTQYGVTVIADELYSRQIFSGHTHVHLCAMPNAPENLVTIIGPSKTESLSGYRLGTAFGTAAIIDRMEKLQAIMALRCGGYNQAVFKSWLNEPQGWLAQRVQQHQAIRDDLLQQLQAAAGIEARMPEGGSYLFVKLPALDVSMQDFIKILRIQAQVIVTPGTEFGPQFTDWFRINFSQNHQAAIAAIERLLTLMERYIK